MAESKAKKANETSELKKSLEVKSSKIDWKLIFIIFCIGMSFLFLTNPEGFINVLGQLGIYAHWGI